MSERLVVTELTPDTLMGLQIQNQRHVIIIKFGAAWCKPCQAIKAHVDREFVGMPPNVICVDIDIDESLDLYVALKSKKMLRGVPAILAFNGDIARDKWYIPDDSFSGSDSGSLAAFFARCRAKAQTLA